ncbi:MAG TPA: glycosyltransferase [Thermoanaerobaculia bacterium]|nr:glycosyltransferase [Thermoanaerobaculia bacterium]
MSTPDAFPRVALVHDWLTGMRGGEKVLEEIAGLFPQAPIHTLIHLPGRVSERLESHPIRTSFLQRAPFVERRYRHYLPLFPSAIESFDLSGFDLVISSSHCVAKGALPAPHAVHLCYCHTPMRYAWDQEAEYFPRRSGPIARARGMLLSRLRTWDAASAARVDLFVANSTFVRQRIRRYYRRDAEVLAPPVDVALFAAGVGEPAASAKEAPYLLSVAALSPYKRHDLAIEAARRTGIELRIVGEGPDRERLRDLGGPIRLLGRVDDATLRRLYRGALAFVQPGVEDFGIAAVESLAAGTPVIAAGRGGVVDIVENERHGLLYDPCAGLEALVAAIDKRRRFRFNPLDLQDRAEGFSRERFRAGLRALVERLALRG